MIAGGAIGIGVGVAMGVSDAEVKQYEFSVLDQPPAGEEDSVPREIDGVRFADAHSNVKIEERRLARRDEGLSLFVAPGRKVGEVCLLALAPTGAAASTCNASRVVDEFGAIPLLMLEPDGSALVLALVPDGVRAAIADDGALATAENNVVAIRVGPDVQMVTFEGAKQQARLNVGLWRDEE